MGRWFGIEIRVHATMLALLAWVLVDAILHRSDPRTESWLTVVGIAVASLCMHELAHACCARALGRPLGPLVLGPISAAWIGRGERERPAHDAWIAAAGPGSNLLAALLLWAWVPADRPTLESTVAIAWTIQIWMGLGNLLPLLPLDGGRILRALLRVRMAPPAADRATAWIGTCVGVVAGIGAWFAPWSYSWVGIVVVVATWWGPARALRRTPPTTTGEATR